MAVTTGATRLVTGKVRLSYVHVFEKWSGGEDQDAKYSVVLLIPKTDKATIRALRVAEAAATEAGKSTKFGGSIPKGLKSIIHDGDEEADLDKNPEYAGCLYMSVGSRTRPGIVDKNVQPILDSTEVYSGCYARVSINAYPYNTKGNRGISFGLNNLQKLADGEQLGGGTRADADFDAVDEDDEDVL